jgi:hypothetical protein
MESIYGGGIHRVGSLTQNDKMATKIMVGRRDLHFDVFPEPLYWSGVIHFPKFYILQRAYVS